MSQQTDSKPPQTFEEWFQAQDEFDRTVQGEEFVRRAFAAGVASQQGLIENLRYHRDVDKAQLAEAEHDREADHVIVVRLEAEIERLKMATQSPEGWDAWRRYEALVGAARAIDRWIAANPDEANAIPIVITSRLRAALAGVEGK